jgi:glycosyltransferase involved in cell wall biosynthesis
MAKRPIAPIPMESSILNRNPAVSIGMPVYNGAQYIREALDSLLSQTFKDFELIISDNASTDATQSICEEYAHRDSRIFYERQVENNGAVANFRFVLDRARADLFMWAAYDDLWAPNYLMDATALLSDKAIEFVFPSFELRSIRLGVAKKFEPEIFQFIESLDRRRRVLNFMALHFLSHSANIVYALFRTNFLRTAWNKQDIGNDGALGAVVLSLGRGIMSNSLFTKRYRLTWPGMLPPAFSIVSRLVGKRTLTREPQRSIDAARLKMLNLFPEYEQEIMFIFDRYRPHVRDRGYCVCSIDGLF